MAEHDSDKEVGRLYGELPREEPPARLDAAIRAEARAAVETHAAPLVAPTGRRSWAFPLAAAAVLVLAVGVTLQVEREDAEPAVPPQNKVAPASEVAGSVAERGEAPRQAKKPKTASRDAARLDAQTGNNLAKQEPAAPPATAAAPAPQATPPAAAERRMQAQAFSALAETPERWLERIAALRKEGKHDEADRQLAEFRKRYPDYKIPPEMLEKVEKR